MSAVDNNQGPLSRYLMLDLTHMLSGPYGTMLLTDLGMQTIKIEPPGKGEGTRNLLANDADYSRAGMGAYFITTNRNKKSVSVDLKSPEGLQIFYDLVRKADVVFDNFSPKVMERLKISHSCLSAINPRIVTCSVTGFGQTGPACDRPAFDMVAQGMGGGMSITGKPEHGPMRAGIPVGDLGGGVFGVIGVLTALHEREVTGVGRHVDISMLDCQFSMLNYMATMYLMSGKQPRQEGNGHFVHVPYNTFKTRTLHIIIAIIFDSFWPKLLRVLNLSHLDTETFREQPGRLANRDYIETEIEKVLETRDADYWLERLNTQKIPCAPVNQFEHAASDPQIRARDMVVDVPLHDGSSVQAPGNPVKIVGSDASTLQPPPRLGQHTAEVLSEYLEMAPEKLEAMEDRGIIQTNSPAKTEATDSVENV